MGGKPIVYVLLIIFLINFSFAATLHGAVYDSGYNQVKNIQVTINTTPKQSLISKNGAYFFFVPLGTYEILAEKFYQRELLYSQGSVVKVSKDGEFQVDIIMEGMPIEIPEEEDLGPSFFTILRARLGAFFVPVIMVILIAFFGTAGYILWWVIKKRPKLVISIDSESAEMPKQIASIGTSVSMGNKDPIIEKTYSADTVLKAIKDEGGRSTQKDIRRRIPLSEAKVSLMISELESQGKIKKIKKGRGNIIILN